MWGGTHAQPAYSLVAATQCCLTVPPYCFCMQCYSLLLLYFGQKNDDDDDYDDYVIVVH